MFGRGEFFLGKKCRGEYRSNFVGRKSRISDARSGPASELFWGVLPEHLLRPEANWGGALFFRWNGLCGDGIAVSVLDTM